jgi:hypothetical protein
LTIDVELRKRSAVKVDLDASSLNNAAAFRRTARSHRVGV